ncbi:MAG TPA: MBL fold metallo-hydrolase [bacterium]|nr:MBL fold metallo-hydrolase [bacterium]
MRAFAVLSSNCAGRQALLAENGLSLYIRYDDVDFLFDTGAGSLFADNAEFMSLPLHKIEFAAISHKHEDHCGGLPFLSQIFSMISGQCDVFCPVDFEFPPVPALRQRPISENCEIISGIRAVVTESVISEEIVKEVSILAGETLFTGCSHAGISKILSEAVKSGPVKTIAGGLHNFNESDSEMKKNAQSIADLGIKKLIVLHCSSVKSIRYFEDCGIEVKTGCVGNSFNF